MLNIQLCFAAAGNAMQQANIFFFKAISISAQRFLLEGIQFKITSIFLEAIYPVNTSFLTNRIFLSVKPFNCAAVAPDFFKSSGWETSPSVFKRCRKLNNNSICFGALPSYSIIHFSFSSLSIFRIQQYKIFFFFFIFIVKGFPNKANFFFNKSFYQGIYMNDIWHLLHFGKLNSFFISKASAIKYSSLSSSEKSSPYSSL